MSRVQLWLALPVALWIGARLILVAPAEQELMQSQRALLSAEREELLRAVGAERSELALSRMKRRMRTMRADAERLDAAESAATAQLISGKTSRSSSGHWVMPHELTQ